MNIVSSVITAILTLAALLQGIVALIDLRGRSGRSKKWFASAAICIIFAVLSGFASYYTSLSKSDSPSLTSSTIAPSTSTPFSPSSTSSPNSAHTLYTGDGYSFYYPTGWKVVTAYPTGTQSTTINVVQSDGSQTALLSLDVTPNSSNLSSQEILQRTITFVETNNQGFTQDTTTPSVVPIGGDNWNAASGQMPLSGIPSRLTILVDLHNNNGFMITYSAQSSIYDQMNTTVFQPILATFKFS